MKNKTGLSKYKLIDIERNLVNLKLNLLDEYFTFNKDIFEIEYLKELHKFLFSDLYFDYQLEMRKIIDSNNTSIKIILDSLEKLCIYFPNEKEQILKCLRDIWYLQPFNNGNTRTLIAYLKILNEAFLLGFDIDVNKNIVSNPATFNANNFVNQKRLTKYK